jgi:hypothetical protein
MTLHRAHTHSAYTMPANMLMSGAPRVEFDVAVAAAKGIAGTCVEMYRKQV